jgi:hypothetical protein
MSKTDLIAVTSGFDKQQRVKQGETRLMPHFVGWIADTRLDVDLLQTQRTQKARKGLRTSLLIVPLLEQTQPIG